ncbi:hypothetical protein SAMN04488498_101400 [Mesorhizobium albiziae]|uniref:Uncharacterized protein n=1 Tax=Neomesorhizobium albiziae TaxID=335020 RepID=A0A1I3VHT0_9HYPH|nr:hypothetical protein [Mesorhizobium albiziae]GLS28858.1 hypothetical protein GCM10007937_05650 [Mesorhizobium albiziae]SFJ93691.1 hypothetical protein SAMN04488498_101400 [Mesorhizobium albiziae]
MFGINPTVDDLRAYVRIAQAKGNTAMLAQDVKVASDVLDRFAFGAGSLPPAILQNLTEYVYAGSFTYDEDSGEIVRVPRAPPVPLGKTLGRPARSTIWEGREGMPVIPLWPMGPEERVNGGWFSEPMPLGIKRQD